MINQPAPPVTISPPLAPSAPIDGAPQQETSNNTTPTHATTTEPEKTVTLFLPDNGNGSGTGGVVQTVGSIKGNTAVFHQQQPTDSPTSAPQDAPPPPPAGAPTELLHVVRPDRETSVSVDTTASTAGVTISGGMQQAQFAQSIENHPEALVVAPRNKGVICKTFFNSGSCSVSNCPYAHVANGEARTIPDSVCMFFAQNACLRDNCKFFHGTKTQLRMLRESGATMYRPQDFMLVRSPLVPANSQEAQQNLAAQQQPPPALPIQRPPNVPLPFNPMAASQGMQPAYAPVTNHMQPTFQQNQAPPPPPPPAPGAPSPMFFQPQQQQPILPQPQQQGFPPAYQQMVPPQQPQQQQQPPVLVHQQAQQINPLVQTMAPQQPQQQAFQQPPPFPGQPGMQPPQQYLPQASPQPQGVQMTYQQPAAVPQQQFRYA